MRVKKTTEFIIEQKCENKTRVKMPFHNVKYSEQKWVITKILVAKRMPAQMEDVSV